MYVTMCAFFSIAIFFCFPFFYYIIFLYADDIILLAPSVQALQLLINICISELNYLDMAINVKKSACMRFGPRYKNVCANVVVSGALINWLRRPGIWVST